MRTMPRKPWSLDRRSCASQTVLRKLAGIPFLPSQGRYNLSISYAKSFVWFRVAKVGTRTILNHFKTNDVPLDVEHASYIYYMPRRYADFFKFAFVRNPWDRLVSSWVDKVVEDNGEIFGFDESELPKMRQFENFVEYVCALDIRTCDRHLASQCALIDLNSLDYLGRMETFSTDFAYICDRLGIASDEVVPRNVTNRRPYREYYDRKLRDKVSDVYWKDIQIFGYEF